MRKSHRRSKKLEKIVYYPRKNYRNAIRILRLLSENEFLNTQEIADKPGKRWGYLHSRIKHQLEYLQSLDYCSKYGKVSNHEHFCDHCEKSVGYLVSMSSLGSALKILEGNRKSRDEAKKKENFNPNDWFNCKDDHVLGRLIRLICFNCNKDVTPHNDEEYKIWQDVYWSLSDNGMFVVLAILRGERLYDFIGKHKENMILKMANFCVRTQQKEMLGRLINGIKQTLKIKPNVMKGLDEWYSEARSHILQMKEDKDLDPELSEYKKKLESQITFPRLMPRY